MSADPAQLYLLSQLLVAGMAAVTMPVLLFIAAPYGRHAGPGWGPQVNARLSWIVMEAPAPLLFLATYAAGPNAWRPVPLLLCGLWVVHYTYRAFLYPLRLRNRGKKNALLAVVLAFLFNCANSFANAWAISFEATHLDRSWLFDPRLWFGTVLFVVGHAVNRRSDDILIHLRKPGETGYRIPQGGLFRWVSCPNYLGEIIEWAGFALAAWTRPALLFFLFTCANLLPRALANHRWYLEKFPDYPKERKALIPYVL